MNPNDFKEITGYNDTKFIVPNDYPEDDNTKNIFGIIEILFDQNYNHTTTSDDTSSASSASNKTDISPRSVSSASTIFDSKLGTNGGGPKPVKAASTTKPKKMSLDEFFNSAPTPSPSAPTLSPAQTFAANIFDKISTIIMDTTRIESLKQCLKGNFHNDVTITHNLTDYGLYFDFSLPYRETPPQGRPDINVFTDKMTTPSYRPFHLSLHHNDRNPKIIPRVTTPGIGKDNPGALHFRRDKEDRVVDSDPVDTEKTYRYQQRLDLGRDGRICGFTNRVNFEKTYKGVDNETSNLSNDTMRGVIDCLNGHIFDYTPPSSDSNTFDWSGTRRTPVTVASATADSNTENKDGVRSLFNRGDLSGPNTSGSNTGENSMDVDPSRGGFKTTKTRKNKTTKTRKIKRRKKTRKIKRRKKTRKRSKDISKTKTRKHR
jgi:hypothetical protein